MSDQPPTPDSTYEPVAVQEEEKDQEEEKEEEKENEEVTDNNKGQMVREWRERVSQCKRTIEQQAIERENEEYSIFVEFQVPLLLTMIEAAINQGQLSITYPMNQYISRNLPRDIQSKAAMKYMEHTARWLSENCEYDGLVITRKWYMCMLYVTCSWE